jgi:polyhydroxyalkanoate synthesis regulator phasin
MASLARAGSVMPTGIRRTGRDRQMADEARPASRPERSGNSTGAWRTYLELAGGAAVASRKQVRKVLKDLVGKGNATAEQLRGMTSELVAANTANRDALGKLIRVEVDRALGRVGLATMDEVNELNARVRELERALKEARATPTEPAATRTSATTRKRAAAAPAATTTTRRRTAAAPAEPTTAGTQRRGRPAAKAAAPAAKAASPAVKKVAKKTVAKKTVAKRAAGTQREAGQ